MHKNFLVTTAVFLFLLIAVGAYPQKNRDRPADTIPPARQDQINFYLKQRDAIDIFLLLLHRNPDKRLLNDTSLSTKLKISGGPLIEYTLATGLTGGFAANGAFVTARDTQTNVSSLLLEFKYTQKHQLLLPLESSIWLKGNQFNLLGDWRYLNYPQDTYGIGGYTTPADISIVTYKYIRVYEYVLRKIAPNLYGGLGYQLDSHWGITQLDVPAGTVTGFTSYGYAPRSVSSGIGLNLLYDSRKNAINPQGGSFYCRLGFLQNSKTLGSNSNWNGLQLDVRKYITVADHMVLAFWLYSFFTLQGYPPYLDLPATGSDTYNNAGRGYETGRFTGKKMIDLEAELRFGITSNGLIGGVVFVNAESVSELSSNRFETVLPAAGIGLRIKLNKFSGTNTCFDYGAGKRSSHGFFGNLGEVF